MQTECKMTGAGDRHDLLMLLVLLMIVQVMRSLGLVVLLLLLLLLSLLLLMVTRSRIASEAENVSWSAEWISFTLGRHAHGLLLNFHLPLSTKCFLVFSFSKYLLNGQGTRVAVKRSPTLVLVVHC
jgi:uncharacterized membrane protein